MDKQPASFLGNDIPRLVDLLEDEKVPLETIRQKYPSQHYMVTRLLGTEPVSACYEDINRQTMIVRDLIIPALLGVPAVDFGMGLSPTLRASMMTTAASAMGCAYCHAHCIGMGTVTDGGGEVVEKACKAPNFSAYRDDFSDAELAALDIAKAVGRFPSQVTIEHRVQLARHYSPKDQEAAVFFAVVMGYLTRFMDTMGMPLEPEPLINANTTSLLSGWVAGKHVQSSDQDMHAQAATKSATKQGANKLELVRHMLGCVITDERIKMGTPMFLGSLRRKMEDSLGFCPYYLLQMKNSGCRRSLACAIRLTFVPEDNSSVTSALRYAVCYLHACRAGNKVLQAHFAFLAHRAGFALSELEKIRQGAQLADTEPKVKIAIEFAEGASGPAPCTLDRKLLERLRTTFAAAEIIDLVGSFAVFALLEWFTSVFPPSAYEPAIQEFVDSPKSEALDLRTTWEDWDTIVASRAT